MRNSVFSFALFFASFLSLAAQVSFEFNSEFKYLKGSQAADLSDGWFEPGFDDSQWMTGPSPFWYGDGSEGTLLSDMQGNYSSFYLRGEFVAAQVDMLKELTFLVNYDDGFIIWVNGEESLRVNVPPTQTNDSYALENHESGFPVGMVIDSTQFDLKEGDNTIAIQVFNTTLSSSDIHFNLSIKAQVELPELDASIGDVTFSHAAGFYEQAFELTLRFPDTTARIVYTLDGSDPKKSSNTFIGGAEAKLEIDPQSSAGRPLTPSVIVRASVQMPGYAPSISRTRTYIFLNEVREQSYPGTPWPSGNLNGQRIDLEMDPDVVNDGRYEHQIETALTDIPTLSLVSDNAHLFDPYFGIYVNAEGHGIDWERDCSLELIDPVGTGFQVNAGMRIRGGASRAGWNPKHAFRLFFREEYGDAKLEYPLFGEDGTEEFDKIDLRTEQNFSWSKDGSPASDHNTFIRDIYSRSLQGYMGQPYTRSRYYHLYLNGLYWGLFMTEERPEARYAESYFGDDAEDYDVVKVTTHAWPYYNIATDGNMDAWEEVYNMCKQGFSSNENYFRLEGKDALGVPLKNSKVLVDIDNLIDYMAMIFYTGSFDGPASAWGGEDMPNNYYAIYNRKNKGQGFVFIAHDQEQSMLVDPLYVGDGLYENRVTIPDMSVAGLLQFHPQWLHFKLSYNPEYRLRFADRVYKYFHNEGLFTPEFAKAMFREFEFEIDKAIIAESARWGDANEQPAKTRDDDWLPELESIYTEFFPRRTTIVIDQIREAELFMDLVPPVFQSAGKNVFDDIVNFSGAFPLDIKDFGGKGEICYTNNGDDPRMIGGEIASSAIVSSSDIRLSIPHTTIIKARIKAGGQWSSLSTLILNSEFADYTDLKITEIHYHPRDTIMNGDTISGKDMEFIELKNTGENTLNISGLILDSAIRYQVPEDSFLPPSAFYVVASKPEVFYDLYGVNPSGNFKGNLSNSGEYVLLTDSSGDKILAFTYNDSWPWPPKADGGGNSLVPVISDPVEVPSSASYWRSSYYSGGSPFADDLLHSGINESTPAGSFRLYPNPSTDFMVIQNGMDEETNIQIYDLSGNLVYTSSFRTEIVIQTDELGHGGLYFIRLHSRNAVTTLKAIVL